MFCDFWSYLKNGYSASALLVWTLMFGASRHHRKRPTVLWQARCKQARPSHMERPYTRAPFNSASLGGGHVSEDVFELIKPEPSSQPQLWAFPAETSDIMEQKRIILFVTFSNSWPTESLWVTKFGVVCHILIWFTVPTHIFVSNPLIQFFANCPI